MDPLEIRKMRKKQFILLNSLLVLMLSLYIGSAIYFSMTMAQSHLLIAILLLIVAIVNFITRKKPMSIFPIMKQIQVYEKMKMGDEWNKQRKVNYISQFVLSGFLFLQYFMTRTIQEPLFERDLLIPIILVFFVIIIVVNISMHIHSKKVDRVHEPEQLKGYTRNTTMIGIVAGLIIGIGLFVLIIAYLIVTA